MEKFKQSWVYWLVGAAVIAAAAFFYLPKAKAADKGGPFPTAAEAAQMFPINSWTAIYAGVGVGTGALTSDFGNGIDGYQLSGRVGGDVQISRILFGIMADYGWDHTTLLGNTNPKEWMVAARAGVLVAENVLVYGLAGERWLSVTGFNTQGLTMGGGVEVALTKHWRLGLEYDHTTYDAIAASREQTVTARLIFALPR
jgi:opacity protein-like surface antigen